MTLIENLSIFRHYWWPFTTHAILTKSPVNNAHWSYPQQTDCTGSISDEEKCCYRNNSSSVCTVAHSFVWCFHFVSNAIGSAPAIVVVYQTLTDILWRNCVRKLSRKCSLRIKSFTIKCSIIFHTIIVIYRTYCPENLLVPITPTPTASAHILTVT